MNEEKDDLAIEIVVLDAYFQCRSNRQELNMVQDNKTTQQIIDETADTLELDDKTVVTYMVEHGYLLTEDDDGSPIWMIYRMR